jgi:hypothetical protein
MRTFANGGIIPGPSHVLKMERLGVCIHGFCLYSIAGDLPEHLLSADEMRKGDTRKLRCQCGGQVKP